jgi:hypothetical protein
MPLLVENDMVQNRDPESFACFFELPGDLQVLFAGSESAGKGDCTYVVMSVISGAIKSTT